MGCYKRQKLSATAVHLSDASCYTPMCAVHVSPPFTQPPACSPSLLVAVSPRSASAQLKVHNCLGTFPQLQHHHCMAVARMFLRTGGVQFPRCFPDLLPQFPRPVVSPNYHHGTRGFLSKSSCDRLTTVHSLGATICARRMGTSVSGSGESGHDTVVTTWAGGPRLHRSLPFHAGHMACMGP